MQFFSYTLKGKLDYLLNKSKLLFSYNIMMLCPDFYFSAFHYLFTIIRIASKSNSITIQCAVKT